MKQFFIFIWEVVEIAVIAFVSVFVIRAFIVQPFLVRGASMEPNFKNGDYLLVDEASLRFRDPERGEVIVFRFPRDPSTFYIKRIIGLPKETVVIRNNAITVRSEEHPDGAVLEEDYLRSEGVTGEAETQFILHEGEYLALGDNRSFSYDSRSWGPVPRKNIIGLARVRLWPLDQFMMFSAPNYGLATP